MICQWEAFLNMLPPRIRKAVNTLGKEHMEELRLRIGQAPKLVLHSGSRFLDTETSMEDLQYILNSASQYSPWAAATLAEGYLTAPGGHRIGICGQAVCDQRKVTLIREPMSLCIRVARDYPGIAAPLKTLNGSVLIIGPPGSGKTTLLRDLIRQVSQKGSVSVVDEKGELFPIVRGKSIYGTGANLDILSGCPKSEGILMVLRNMGPDCIAVDEITSEDDCAAIMKAGWCGVSLLATAHAGNMDELCSRSTYRPIVNTKLFHHIVCLSKDKTWRLEGAGI